MERKTFARPPISETVPERPQPPDRPFPFDPLFAEAQRIEGGGPPNRVRWTDLPRPLRWFGLFVTGASGGDDAGRSDHLDYGLNLPVFQTKK